MEKRHLLGAVTAAVVVVTVFATGAAAARSSVLLPPTVTVATDPVVQESATKLVFRVQAGSALPVSYLYQLNQEPPQVVAATNGRASVKVFPDRFTNVVSVFSRAADGSLSADRTVLTINAVSPPPFADQDLDGDGQPDLVTVGGTPGLAPGLWQATGRGDVGRVQVPALDIGANGNGVSGVGSPADFNGAQVITGKFTGPSFEDFLVYYPGGFNAGGGMVITGNGRGAVLTPQLSGHELTMNAGILSDLNGNNPIQIVNGYDGAAGDFGVPDLIGIVGDPTNGYALEYYVGGPMNIQVAAPLALPTPAGGTDWQNWRIASTLLPGGTALLLWNPGTGALYLWESVTFNLETSALSFVSYPLSASWQPGAQFSTVQLCDVNADGVPDIRAVTPDGDVTAFTVTNLSNTGPATIHTGRTQHLT